MVWKHSFGNPRVFRVFPRLNDRITWTPMIVNHKPPSSGSACRESRQIFHKCGEFLFGADGLAIKSLWFRPSEDILYGDHARFDYPEVDRFPSDCGFATVENVAINWRGRNDRLNLRLIGLVLDEFPNCKRLILVMTDGRPLYKGDVEFLYIKEDDQQKVCF